MLLRFFGPVTGSIIAALAVFTLYASPAHAEGSEYTYIGLSYEWTDVKYGINPSVDPRFNNGSINGENIDFSLGILDWLHVQGQAFGYFDGTCDKCGTNQQNGATFDSDLEAYKIGAGVNFGGDLIGWTDKIDLVLRANYVDTKLKKLNSGSPSSLSDDGWSVEGMIRSRISDRADISLGYDYYRLSDNRNRDLAIALNYRIYKGLSIRSRGIIFDTETGLELGLRWYFGDLAFGRDRIAE